MRVSDLKRFLTAIIETVLGRAARSALASQSIAEPTSRNGRLKHGHGRQTAHASGTRPRMAYGMNMMQPHGTYTSRLTPRRHMSSCDVDEHYLAAASRECNGWQSRGSMLPRRPGGAALLYPAAVKPPSHRRRTGSPGRGGQSRRVLAEGASCQARWARCGERSGETGCRAHRTRVTRTLKLKDPGADRAGSWRSGIVPAARRSVSVCSGDRVRAACRKHLVVD